MFKVVVYQAVYQIQALFFAFYTTVLIPFRRLQQTLLLNRKLLFLPFSNLERWPRHNGKLFHNHFIFLLQFGVTSIVMHPLRLIWTNCTTPGRLQSLLSTMMKDEGNTILHNLHSNHKSRARPVKEEAELEEWKTRNKPLVLILTWIILETSLLYWERQHF